MDVNCWVPRISRPSSKVNDPCPRKHHCKDVKATPPPFNWNVTTFMSSPKVWCLNNWTDSKEAVDGSSIISLVFVEPDLMFTTRTPLRRSWINVKCHHLNVITKSMMLELVLHGSRRSSRRLCQTRSDVYDSRTVETLLDKRFVLPIGKGLLESINAKLEVRKKFLICNTMSTKLFHYVSILT